MIKLINYADNIFAFVSLALIITNSQKNVLSRLIQDSLFCSHVWSIPLQKIVLEMRFNLDKAGPLTALILHEAFPEQLSKKFVGKPRRNQRYRLLAEVAVVHKEIERKRQWNFVGTSIS